MEIATNIYEQVPDDDTPGGRLGRARDARGLTVRDLAWKLGVMQATVKKWESDRSAPSAHRLALLAGLLDVSLAWLLHGVGTGPVETDTTAPDDIANQFDRLVALQAESQRLMRQIERSLAGRRSA